MINYSSLYNCNLATHPILPREKELNLAYLIQEMSRVDRVKGQLQVKLNHMPNLEEVALEMGLEAVQIENIYKRGLQAKTELIKHNLRLVISIARSFYRYTSSLSLEDLIQEGCIGLERAAYKYNPELGYKFSSYATHWVKQSLHKVIENRSHLIRLPVDLQRKMKQIKDAVRVLGKEGKNPRLDAIDKLNKWKRGHACKVINYTYRAQAIDSINRRVGEGESTEMVELLGEANSMSWSGSNYLEEQKEFADLVEELLAFLPDADRKIIMLRYGLTCNPHTLVQVAKKFNLSAERIRQLEEKALGKMKKHAKALKITSMYQ